MAAKLLSIRTLLVIFYVSVREITYRTLNDIPLVVNLQLNAHMLPCQLWQALGLPL